MQTSQRKPHPIAALTALAAGLAVGLISTPSLAQDDAKPLLSGPAVETTESGPSLVRRGFDGQMERLGQQPEIAAVEMLELSDAERSVVDMVLGERAALIDGIVRANRATVQEIGQARKAKDREGIREAMQKLRPALEPALEQGSLTELISAALPEGKQADFTRLLSEYHTAMRERQREQLGDRPGRDDADAPRRGGRRGRGAPPADAMDAMGGPGMPGEFDAPPPFELELGEDAAEAPRRGRRAGAGEAGQRATAMRSLMQEIQSSYGRLVTEAQDRRADLDAVLASLDLSAEQRAAIESTLAEIREARAQSTNAGEPSQQERTKAMRAIAQHLTPEQRRVLRTELRGGRD